ncbi:hypothetical protein [Streptomyces sp. STCH 565 A]|uniref:hypothetical protein n=1 Tax=Streptomyces sp. STCH 565 A TaxID=2950532 RepID=UPI0020763CB9|nr:hypothetical protein [Streptomyces sp. STCH 565 A]MCM8552285.1 hypothetical protein [Streptomyces sp. STCH 565 A]
MITDRELIRAFVAAHRRGDTTAAQEAARVACHRFIADPLTTNAYQAIVEIQAAVPPGTPQQDT